MVYYAFLMFLGYLSSDVDCFCFFFFVSGKKPGLNETSGNSYKKPKTKFSNINVINTKPRLMNLWSLQRSLSISLFLSLSTVRFILTPCPTWQSEDNHVHNEKKKPFSPSLSLSLSHSLSLYNSIPLPDSQVQLNAKTFQSVDCTL